MNKKLNILIFSPLSLEYGRGGEISAMELASGLNKYYNITLIDTNISLDKSLQKQESILKKLQDVKRNTRVKFATFRFYNKIFTFIYPQEILKLYKKIKENNIIYTSCFTIKTNLLLIFFSLLLHNTKFIIGYRKPLYSDKVLSLYNLKYRISILLFSLLKKKFHHHTISFHAKKYLENFFPREKVTHIIHGIEMDNYIDNGIDMKQEETLNLIYVGNLDDIHKGVGVLLDAIEGIIEKNKDLKVVFEFCGKGILEPRLIKLQEAYPDYIKFNGYVKIEKISEYYKRNDIFMFTSRREPFGRVLIEALASRLIILCSKTIGSIEILKGKEFAFFIKDLTPKSFQNKFYEVYNLWKLESERFKKLQKSARDYAIHNYSFSKELEMFRKLINKIS